MGRWDFCDEVCLSVVPTSVQEEKVGFAPGDGFMAVEFLWEALLFGWWDFRNSDAFSSEECLRRSGLFR